MQSYEAKTSIMLLNWVILFRCLPDLDGLKLETKDEQRGVDIVMRSLRTPCGTIAKNSGADPSVVVQKVIAAEAPSMGYDALHDRYVDMIQEGEFPMSSSARVPVYLCRHPPFTCAQFPW